MDILYNDYFKSHTSKPYNNLNSTNLENKIKTNKQWLLTQSKIMKLNNTYDQAPDKVAYDYYGDDLYYPVVMEMNNISSVFNFTIDNLDGRVILPSLEAIHTIL